MEEEKGTTVSATDRRAAKAKHQCEAGLEFRQPRFDKIRENEELLDAVERPALLGRSNVPFDAMMASGFVETLRSKIDEPIRAVAEPTTEKDLKAARMMTSAHEYLSSPDNEHGDWNEADLDCKAFAIIGGRGFIEKYTESKPEFRDVCEAVDYFDMVTEPGGPSNLDKHRFKYRMNTFRSRAEMLARANAGIYDMVQVKKLLNVKMTSDDRKEYEDQYRNKANRYLMIGQDIESHDYIGEVLYNMTSGVMFDSGKWWWIVFDFKTGIWVRQEPLVKVFKSNLGPWTSFAPLHDPRNFWCRGPLDVFKPIAVSMKMTLDAMFDNFDKLNWDMTGYDEKMVKNAKELFWRPNGLVRMSRSENGSIKDGIFQFQTKELGPIAINMLQFLNNIAGEKTASTPGAQGNAEEQRVGIYFGNIQQIQDRFGLVNKHYVRMQRGLLKRQEWGLYEHMPRKMQFQILGPKGVEWKDMVREDVEPDFRWKIDSATAETAANELKMKKREIALEKSMKYPEIAAELSPRWIADELLKFGEWEAEERKVAMDRDSFGNSDLLSEAAQAIDQIVVHGKVPKPNREANTAYVRKIYCFIQDTEGLDKETIDKLMKYADSHKEIVLENAARYARMRALATLENAIKNGEMEADASGLVEPPAPSPGRTVPPLQARGGQPPNEPMQ